MSEILKTAAALFLLGEVDAEDIIHNLELLATQLNTIIHRRSFVNGPASKVGSSYKTFHFRPLCIFKCVQSQFLYPFPHSILTPFSLRLTQMTCGVTAGFWYEYMGNATAIRIDVFGKTSSWGGR